MKSVSICVLTYGDHPDLAKRAIGSVLKSCPQDSVQLIVGANEVCGETEEYLRHHARAGEIDELVVSRKNINKCPMMRRMLAKVKSGYVWWFDDDSYISDPGAYGWWIHKARAASTAIVGWGQVMYVDAPPEDYSDRRATRFVREADWYRGLPPPSWRFGGKGEFNWGSRGTGDGRWFFLAGGCWMARTRALVEMNWPDVRLIKNGDDVFMGEAIRQCGWRIEQVAPIGVAINTKDRRGSPGFRIESEPGSLGESL